MSATIYEPGEGIRTIDLMGTTVTAKADGAGTGDAFVVAEMALAPGGFETPLHLHRHADVRRHGAGVRERRARPRNGRPPPRAARHGDARTGSLLAGWGTGTRSGAPPARPHLHDGVRGRSRRSTLRHDRQPFIDPPARQTGGVAPRARAQPRAAVSGPAELGESGWRTTLTVRAERPRDPRDRRRSACKSFQRAPSSRYPVPGSV